MHCMTYSVRTLSIKCFCHQLPPLAGYRIFDGSKKEQVSGVAVLLKCASDG